MTNDPHIAKLLAVEGDDAFWAERDASVLAMRQKEREERAARELQRRKERWEVLPALYRELFDPKKSRLGRDAIQHCKVWTPESGVGIGLVGATGLGKTRLITTVLRRFHESHNWVYLPAFEMSNLVAKQWSDDDWTAMDAVRRLKQAKRVAILVIDDVGDERSTEASSAFLKELAEHRMSHKLPILWTSNLTKEALAAKHGVQGAAVVRRLLESCTIF
jgi:DNA replication protein DnaC